MSYLMTAKCGQCGRVHRIPAGSPGVFCDCHLYCSSGDKPRDCSTSEYNYSGPLGWPAGSHQGAYDEGDDIRHRARYCSTHGKYIYKTPVFLEADYSQLKDRYRLPKKYRNLRSG